MVWGMGKNRVQIKAEQEAKELENIQSQETENTQPSIDRWSQIQIDDDGGLVFNDPPELTKALEENVDASPEFKEELRAKIMAKYPADKFYEQFVDVLKTVGSVARLDTLRNIESEQDFMRACEVLHRRMATPATEPVLEFLSKGEIRDLVVVYLGFAPLGGKVFQEIKAKKKARQMGQTGKAESKRATSENHSSDNIEQERKENE